MVTTTTKIINYSITKGNRTDNVDATITSTSGFSGRALKSKLVLLKILQLLLMTGALVLLLIHFRRNNLYYARHGDGQLFSPQTNSNLSGTFRLDNPDTVVVTSDSRYRGANPVAGQSILPYEPINYYWTAMIRGSVFYWAMVVTAVITLSIFLLTYIVSTTTWILISRATSLEVWYNTIMAICMLVASIVAFVHVLSSGFYGDYYTLPLIASVLGIATGLLYLFGIIIARRDLRVGSAPTPHRNGGLPQ